MSSTAATPKPEAVFRLIYRSRSLMPANTASAELAKIFSTARANNKASDITGALMMHEAWFAQVLEGPEDKVRALFEKIKTDKRHDVVETRTQGMVSGRAFARWAMAEVQDQGEHDMPILATQKGLEEGAPWKVSATQTPVLAELRLLTRGYGKGA